MYGKRDETQREDALVTGSDQGIGQGIALRLAEEGADVVVNYRKNRDGAEETRAQIEQMGRRSVSIQADIGQVADAHRVVDEAIDGAGRDRHSGEQCRD